MSKKCEWYRSPEEDEYQSDCGHSFYFVDSTLSEQGGFKFCPFCSLEIMPKEPVQCPVCHWDMDPDEGCINEHATAEKGQ